MSPERIAPDRFGFKNSRPTISSDCYSLGMVIYETISGNVPFHRDTDLAVFMKVVEGKHPPQGVNFSKSLWEMLERCWASGPGDRPSIEDVFRCLEMVSSLSEPASPRANKGMDDDGDDWDSATNSSGGDSADFYATDDRAQPPPVHTPRDHHLTDAHRATLPSHQSVPSRSYPSPWAENEPAAPRSPPTQPLPEPPSRRYDPRNDGRDPRELRDYDLTDTRPELRSRPPSHHGSPESVRNTLRQPPPPPTYSKRSPSPHLPSHPGIQISENRVPSRRRGSQREKLPEPPYSPGSLDAKRDRKRKNPIGPMTGMRRKVDDSMYIDRPPNDGQPSFRVNAYPPRVESPESVSSGDSVIRSVHQAPTAAPVSQKHYVDEDYDEGVAEVLADLATYRAHIPASRPRSLPPVQGPSGRTSPRLLSSHHESISSNRGDRASPGITTRADRKRPFTPPSEDDGGGEMKRPKVDGPKLSPTPEQTPTPPRRPSPVPFRTRGYYSPLLFANLPGSGMALPPIATLSPTSSGE